jgi:hypothetical protein
VAPPTYRVCRADAAAFVVFCFETSEDAQVFADRFGGKRLASPAGS